MVRWDKNIDFWPGTLAVLFKNLVFPGQEAQTFKQYFPQAYLKINQEIFNWPHKLCVMTFSASQTDQKLVVELRTQV